MSLNDLKIDKTWSLFLDRDGVINKRLPGDYVKTWSRFEFLPGVINGLKDLSEIFGRVFIVSNQQGIGKGLMTAADLDSIHSNMIREIERSGGRIDKIYFCPSLKEENSFMRKPKTGMALKARKEFPGINFKRSVMVGDSVSDMLFGRNTGMVTVMINEDRQMISKNHQLIDFAFQDFSSFTTFFNQK